MTTTVINIKDAPGDWARQSSKYAYIGRAGRGQSGSWGNPFPMSRNRSRQESLDLYADWLSDRPNAWLAAMRRDLKDKILICFCKPLDCHGDIIAEMIDKYYEGV